MTHIASRKFDTPTFKGEVTFNTSVINPATGEKITSVLLGGSKDVDIAVEVARKAYKTVWGLKTSGAARGKILNKLADLVEQNEDELAALEALNGGRGFLFEKTFAIRSAISTLRYFSGWADKVHGQTMETSETKFAYSRREPYGVVGAIIPWNGPLALTIMKLAPALATGNVVLLKPSELTPLTALRLVDMLNEAGVPPGVVNVINGYGHTVGQAIAEHPGIDKISFTGSTLTGRKILKASADSNLKSVSLELGGKSPAIVFNDADIEQAVKWVTMGIFVNAGQLCCAGSRIFIQEGIYDEFIQRFKEAAKNFAITAGDPFTATTQHAPQISQNQYDRVIGYIKSGKEAGATLACGGQRIGTAEYYVEPTIFTDVKPEMSIAEEEIFGPVATVFKFKTEEGTYLNSHHQAQLDVDWVAEVIEAANTTNYGLAAHIYTENSSRAIRMAHALEAGTVWINFTLQLDNAVPFGGYKQSGIGRELGEYGIETYTQVKGIHINLGLKL